VRGHEPRRIVDIGEMLAFRGAAQAEPSAQECHHLVAIAREQPGEGGAAGHGLAGGELRHCGHDVAATVARLLVSRCVGRGLHQEHTPRLIEATARQEPGRGAGGIMAGALRGPVSGEQAGGRQLGHGLAQCRPGPAGRLAVLVPLDGFAGRMRAPWKHGLPPVERSSTSVVPAGSANFSVGTIGSA
jgi:hypothetical protein